MNIFQRIGGLFEKRELGTTDMGSFAALLTPDRMTVEKALNIPAVSACTDYIASVIAMLPIKLYREKDGQTEEVKNDNRVRLLNDDTGDLLDPFMCKKAFISDYLLSGRGAIYINRRRNTTVSLNYVAPENMSVTTNCDPIFRAAKIYVMGAPYRPDEFIMMCRDTIDGVRAVGLVEKNKEILSAGYNALLFEKNQVKKGGSKKGFLKAEKRLEREAREQLENEWNAKYANNDSNVMVLNAGLDFVPTASTSVEMQLNETKKANNELICSLFNLSPDVISGKATAEQNANATRAAILPTIIAFQTALNKTLLLESEKSNEYFAVDMTELLKGDLLKRYSAYKIGLDSNFLQIDEIRYKEDLKPLGFNYVKLGLDSVLLDPKTNTVYTANTNQTTKLGAKQILRRKKARIGLTEDESRGIVEKRYNQKHDDKGRFAESGRFSMAPLELDEAEYAHVCGEISTYYDRYKGKKFAVIRLANADYWFENNGFGDYNIFGKEGT